MARNHSTARALAPALAIVLAACGAPTGEALITARAAALDPPQLWLVESLDADGAAAGAVQVCADRSMRDGFRRAHAEVNGEPCLARRDAVDRPGLYAVRCELGGRRYGLTVAQEGDPERAFSIRFALQALDGSDAAVAQTRRFRRLGPCPAGWRIGDQGPPGGAPGGNALSGVWGG